MENKTKHTSITVRQDTYDYLQAIKSCYQLKFKKNITYDEIIMGYTTKGLEDNEPQIAEILKLVAWDPKDAVSENNEEDTEQDTAETEKEKLTED